MEDGKTYGLVVLDSEDIRIYGGSITGTNPIKLSRTKGFLMQGTQVQSVSDQEKQTLVSDEVRKLGLSLQAEETLISEILLSKTEEQLRTTLRRRNALNKLNEAQASSWISMVVGILGLLL